MSGSITVRTASRWERFQRRLRWQRWRMLLWFAFLRARFKRWGAQSTLDPFAPPADPSSAYVSGLEAQVARAHETGDIHSEAAARVDLCYARYDPEGPRGFVGYAHETWSLAERNRQWDQLARLSMLFARLALHKGYYQRVYDHSANACAYALLDSRPLFAAVTAWIDQSIAKMIAEGHAGHALNYCDMLIAYEEAGGLGRSVRSFSRHFSAKRDEVRAHLIASEQGE